MANPTPRKSIGLREIAARAECSVGTVSMALNDRPELAEATRKRVQAIAQELGYVANRLAKSLSSGRAGVIGVVMPYSIDPYYAAILDALNTEAEGRGYQLQIQFHRWAMDAEERAIRRLAESRVEGILLYPARARYAGTSLYKWLETLHIPFVSFNGRGGDLPRLALQMVKNYASERELVCQELARLGHRDIDLLEVRSKGDMKGSGRDENPGPSTDPCGVKIRLFERKDFKADETIEFFQKNGFSPEAYHAHVRELVDEYVASKGRGSAVYTSNNELAWKLVSALRKAGISCPGDVSVVGNGIMHHGAGGGIPLSAIEYDAAEIARVALDGIIRKIENGVATGRVLLNPRFVTRETTGMWGPSEKPGGAREASAAVLKN